MSKVGKIALVGLMLCLLSAATLALGLLRSPLEVWRAHKRDRADAVLAASLPAVPCPKQAFVILALGQSNAGNHLGNRTPVDPTAAAFAFFRDRCVLIGDPVPGATGLDGSIWPLLARQIARERRMPVVVIAGAAAGSKVADWQADYASMASRAVRSVTEAIAQGLQPNVGVWLQGENDNSPETTATAYAGNLERVLRHFQAVGAPGPSWPWVITRTSVCFGGPHDAVRAGQAAVARTLGVPPGPDTDTLNSEHRRDRCHFNDQGRDAIVELLVRHIGQHVK